MNPTKEDLRLIRSNTTAHRRGDRRTRRRFAWLPVRLFVGDSTEIESRRTYGGLVWWEDFDQLEWWGDCNFDGDYRWRVLGRVAVPVVIGDGL